MPTQDAVVAEELSLVDLRSAEELLYIDLSSRNPLDSYSGRLVSIEEQRLDDGEMVLKEDWKTLMETHPGRVMVGTDVWVGEGVGVMVGTGV